MTERKLKIAMLSIHSCPMGQLGSRDTGGMNVYVRELSRVLGELEHQVDIYTRAHDPTYAQIHYLDRNVRLIHINAGKVKSMTKSTQYSHLPEFLKNLEDFRRRDGLKYDIIHSHYWLSGQVGQWLAQLWLVPHIVMFHTLGIIKEMLGALDNDIKLRLETERGLVNNCNRIVAATEREKDDLMIHYKAPVKKVNVIPCGVDIKLFSPVDKEKAKQSLFLEDSRVILFVGRIEQIKGIDQLLIAISHLKRWPKLKLLIIGGDDSSQLELAKLKGLVRKLRIENSVLFLGSITQQELSLYYSAADCCIVPSYYESFGLVILESMASGTPVVATNVGVAPDIIQQGKNGYLIEDNEPRRMARTIKQHLSSNRSGNNYANAIRESVLEFDWHNIGSAIIKQYTSSLHGYHIPLS